MCSSVAGKSLLHEYSHDDMMAAITPKSHYFSFITSHRLRRHAGSDRYGLPLIIAGAAVERR